MGGEDRPGRHSLGQVLEWSETEAGTPGARRPRARGPRGLVEALAWALFSAGGFVAAFLLPAHVAILGIAYPAGWLPKDALSYQRMHHLLQNPITKLYVLALVSLPLFHWAHRFRFAIHHQFGIGLRRAVAAGCYGAALTGTGLAVWFLLRM